MVLKANNLKEEASHSKYAGMIIPNVFENK
jgi:hypothetical protein